jgi:NAD(P)-dependent dehydrogenase (short-subunit alcohol dehydrogenase family)
VSETPRVAIVTGGARRIGAAIARRLALGGYAVLVHHRGSAAEAEALCAELGRAAAVAADLADPASAGRILAAASALGVPGVLVNNASLFASDDLASLDAAAFDRTLAINLRAPLLLSQAFARHAGGEDPSIVNVVDHRVWKLTPQHLSYPLSTAALWTATTALAQGLAPRIRVNAVGPGPTVPNPLDGEDGLQREAAGTPLGRAVRPEEVAEAVAYLAGARSVTGQLIAVDSGQHIGWRTPDIVD